MTDERVVHDQPGSPKHVDNRIVENVELFDLSRAARVASSSATVAVSTPTGGGDENEKKMDAFAHVESIEEDDVGSGIEGKKEDDGYSVLQLMEQFEGHKETDDHDGHENDDHVNAHDALANDTIELAIQIATQYKHNKRDDVTLYAGYLCSFLV